MKSRVVLVLVAAAFLVLAALPASAQLTTVLGKCTDEAGQPIAGATLDFTNLDNGTKFSLKTDKKGEYFSIGISLGKYKIVLSKDGKQLWYFNNYGISVVGDVRVDFDLAKERAASSGGKTDTKEVEKYKKEQAEVSKANADIKVLNEKLAASAAAGDAGNWDQAVSIMEEAVALDSNRDLLWARLGAARTGYGAKLRSSKEEADRDAAPRQFSQAIDNLQKAISMHPAKAGTSGDNDLGGYHNMLAEAFAKSGRPQDALNEYSAAAAADPANTAMYYFNGGAVLTNQSVRETDPAIRLKDLEQANALYDKAIAVKPEYSEAWYQKAVNLLNQLTTDKNGKNIVVPGTVEALNKYLELDPAGKHADEVKADLQFLGETVQTSYKKSSDKSTKKPK